MNRCRTNSSGRMWVIKSETCKQLWRVQRCHTRVSLNSKFHTVVTVPIATCLVMHDFSIVVRVCAQMLRRYGFPFSFVVRVVSEKARASLLFACHLEVVAVRNRVDLCCFSVIICPSESASQVHRMARARATGTKHHHLCLLLIEMQEMSCRPGLDFLQTGSKWPQWEFVFFFAQRGIDLVRKEMPRFLSMEADTVSTAEANKAKKKNKDNQEHLLGMHPYTCFVSTAFGLRR